MARKIMLVGSVNELPVAVMAAIKANVGLTVSCSEIPGLCASDDKKLCLALKESLLRRMMQHNTGKSAHYNNLEFVRLRRTAICLAQEVLSLNDPRDYLIFCHYGTLEDWEEDFYHAIVVGDLKDPNSWASRFHSNVKISKVHLDKQSEKEMVAKGVLEVLSRIQF